MHLLPALGCHSTHPPKHVLIVQGWLGGGGSDASLSFSPDRPTNALSGTNLACTVVSPMGRCHCLPENPDKPRLHVAGHCSAVKCCDVAAREGLQRGGGSHPCT